MFLATLKPLFSLGKSVARTASREGGIRAANRLSARDLSWACSSIEGSGTDGAGWPLGKRTRSDMLRNLHRVVGFR